MYQEIQEDIVDLDPPLVRRKLESGTIGTGLFVASAGSLGLAGPAGALVAYMTVGIMVYFVVASLGEMATLIPVSGSFNTYASRFVDEALGFTMGWNYWFAWAISLPAEITAMTLILRFWFPDIAAWIWCIVILFLVVFINLFGVEGFGETEYWLSMIKVVAVVLFILVGMIIAFIGLPGHPAVHFTNYQIDEAPFVNGIIGIFKVYSIAFFSYGGTELVGITAGEAQNPRVTVPKAINGTFWRITIFYALSIFVLGLLIPYNDPLLSVMTEGKDGSMTPFTLAFTRAGITFAAHIMNAVILVAAFSAANSSIYATSRTLMAMAEEGKAPMICAYKSKKGIPLVSLMISSSFGLISFLSVTVGSSVVFNWLANVTGMSSLLTWILICVIHLRFRQAYISQGYNENDLPYRSPFYPYGQFLAIFMGLLVLAGESYSAFEDSKNVSLASVVGLYIGLPLYLMMYLIYKWVKKTRLVPLKDCDFTTGSNLYDMYKMDSLESITSVDDSATLGGK